MNLQALSDKLQEGIREKNLSERELALAADTSNTTVNRLIKCKISKPNVEILRNIEKVLGFEVDELVRMAYPKNNEYEGYRVHETATEYEVEALAQYLPDDDVLNKYKEEQLKKIRLVERVTKEGISVEDLEKAIDLVIQIRKDRK